ncbi:unnamed protein product [Ilex paraguariensis]|uniref:Uncharacterized protein n=1 Tax=Ilex paraguariensis TaxID=185542 RepID=A0ABC8UM25_9AQUA
MVASVVQVQWVAIIPNEGLEAYRLKNLRGMIRHHDIFFDDTGRLPSLFIEQLVFGSRTSNYLLKRNRHEKVLERNKQISAEPHLTDDEKVPLAGRNNNGAFRVTEGERKNREQEMIDGDELREIDEMIERYPETGGWAAAGCCWWRLFSGTERE